MLMIVCILSMYVACVGDEGSFYEIFEKANLGQRLNINFEMDPSRRYSFLACIISGLVYGLCFHGTNQIQVQKVLSLSNANKAKSSLQWSILPVSLMYVGCAMIGIILYSIYYDCDPILNEEQTGITRYNQLVPAFILSKYSSISGMTGLYIAGIFSASLGTMSSALNSASTITVYDFIKPLYKNGDLSDIKMYWLAKVMSIFYGAVCICLSFSFSCLKIPLQLATALIRVTQGPILAVFLVGVLSRKASDKCVSFAFIAGNVITSWIAFGSLFSHYNEPSLPLSINMCNNHNTTNYDYLNISSTFNLEETSFSSLSTELPHA
nr:putative sodium-dependent multivitamin transporter [Parasteatoda tepidariorum]